MAASAFAVNLLKSDVLSNKTYIMIIAVVIIIILTLGYISIQLNLKTSNCAKLSNKSNNTVSSIIDISNASMLDTSKTLNNFFIKTAHNCCCVGNFKNDYVDKCALKNCAYYGVRALDFQVYSLKNKPIISASFIESTQYKEIYNHLTFYETLLAVRQYFIDDSENRNRTDPLFLIFRLFTKNAPIYDMMAQSLNEVFGYSSKTGNRIYMTEAKTLDYTPLSRLNNQVIIIIDPSQGDSNAFENSRLLQFTSMMMFKTVNHIYRETKLLADVSTTDVSNNLTILYPDLQQNKANYDFVTSGIFNNISFIGMNFQYYDGFLALYNGTEFFSKCAFLDKVNIITSLCALPKYNPGGTESPIKQCRPIQTK